MARTARITVHFVETFSEVLSAGVTARDFTVECRQGQRSWSIGRISGTPGAYNALPIGATAWTRWHRTRSAALSALHAREDFRDPESYILAA
jgi:hypothetical protein